MALRQVFWAALVRIGGGLSGDRADDDIRQAASLVVEALEARQLLSVAPLTPAQIDYTWTHLTDEQHHLVAVTEYEDPAFAAQLQADLLALGLPVVQPEPGTLSDSFALAKNRFHRPAHPRAHAKPRRHRRHGKDQPQSPHVTGISFNYQGLARPIPTINPWL